MITYSEYYELVGLGLKKLRKELAEAEQYTLSSYQQAIENETKQPEQPVQEQESEQEKEKPADVETKGTK